MRIAVLVFGRLNKCAEHYDNIIASLGGADRDIDFFLSSDNAPESSLNDFIRLYKPIVYNNSPIHYDYDLNKYPGRIETDIHNMTCHFINKNRVFSLLEEHMDTHNIRYDCAVSMRIDCVFQNNFAFDTFEDNTIYIPYGYDWVHNGINDQIAYGNIDVMRKYNCINAVDLLEKKLSILHPESLHYANILYHKLNVVRTDVKYHLDK